MAGDTTKKRTAVKQTKEDILAKITFRQVIITTFITAFFTTAGSISVAVINRPTPVNSTEGEVEYYEEAKKTSIESLDNTHRELTALSENIDGHIKKETDTNQVAILKKEKEIVDSAVGSNREAKLRFEEKAVESIKETKENHGVAAAIARKKANEILKNNSEERKVAAEELKELPERYKLPMEDNKPFHQRCSPKPKLDRIISGVLKKVVRPLRSPNTSWHFR